MFLFHLNLYYCNLSRFLVFCLSIYLKHVISALQLLFVYNDGQDDIEHL